VEEPLEVAEGVGEAVAARTAPHARSRIKGSAAPFALDMVARVLYSCASRAFECECSYFKYAIEVREQL
jgi:hypothetical protein